MWRRFSSKRNRLLTRSTKREGPSKPEGDPDPNQENSLLNKNKKVKGKVIPLENYQVNDCQPNAGVYCIYCKTNGMHYVGESINLKDRLKEHHDLLRAGDFVNSKLKADLGRYGLSSFEFIVHNTDNSMVDFQTRLNLQNKLQTLLNSLNICYNSGLNETVNPRSTGQWPTQPGICLFYCTETNTYYMSGTSQRAGIRGRMHSIRSALRAGKYKNTALQQDWSKYGETAFQLKPYEFGNNFGQMSNDELFLYTQTQIKSLVKAGYRFYNDTQSLVKPAMNLPKIESKEYFQATVDYYNPPAGVNGAPINMSNRICLVAKGNTYLSVAEAAECLGVNQNVVKSDLDTGKYRKATREEVTSELVRRNWSNRKDLAVPNLPETKTTKGIPVPVRVNGVIYPTMAAAAKANGISPKAMRKRVDKNSPECRKLTPEEIAIWRDQQQK